MDVAVGLNVIMETLRDRFQNRKITERKEREKSMNNIRISFLMCCFGY